MNKLICRLTGGHQYEDRTLKGRIDMDTGMVIFSNKCVRCGKVRKKKFPMAEVLPFFEGWDDEEN